MEINDRKARIACITVAALGYFVDVYDLLLFSVVRIKSLEELGYSGEQLLAHGVLLLNIQMFGMLLGGILWGVWGDKRGRVSVLFGSIFLYSIANILNGFVYSIESYAILRLLAGIGLAGELGAGITLVSETMDKEKRGYGTTLVASVGVAGACAAAVVGEMFHWRTSYFIGGGMGLLLLAMRIAVYESGIFSQMAPEVVKGNIKMLFFPASRFLRYLACIVVGLPIWYVVGILITFSPEISTALDTTEPLVAARAVFYCYLGLVFGDLASGLYSQVVKSRKKSILIFLVGTLITSYYFLIQEGPSSETMYFLSGVVGFFSGYWAVFVTTASEQFGTNIRATVTTTVPNFVRGAVVPVTTLFLVLTPKIGIISSAMLVGAICFALAFLSLWYLKESFGKDLNFIEE